jgi:hypothetical protein
VSAAGAALARAEAVGLRLRLEGGGRVRWRCRGEPPAGLLAELRRHRDEVVRLLAERQAERRTCGAAGVPYAPDDPYASAPGAAGAAAGGDAFVVGCEVRGIAGGSIAGAAAPGTAPSWVRAARTASGDAWLGGIAAVVRAALADGAEREADPDGWLILVRPDGRRSLTAPRTVAELAAAGLLPALPEALETLEAARCARPPSWSEAEDVPLPGDRCRCGGRRWWCEAEAPRGWRCWTCHPPDHLPAGSVRGMRT